MFQADGTFINRIGKGSQTAPYQIDGDEVVFLVEPPNGEMAEQCEQFSLAGDTLTFHDSPRSKRVFERQPD